MLKGPFKNDVCS